MLIATQACFLSSSLVVLAGWVPSDARPAAQAAQGRQDVWVATWGKVPIKSQHLVPMVFLEGDFRPDQENESVNAESLARRLAANPPGHRALLVQRYCHSFWGAKGDLGRTKEGMPYTGPWADNALRQIARDWPRILSLVKYCDATIDLLIADFEESGAFSTWSLPPETIDAIRGDSRWSQPVFGLGPLSQSLSTISKVSAESIKDPVSPYQLAWNQQVECVANRYQVEALWTPAKAIFPNLRGSNFAGYKTDAIVPPERNGHLLGHDNVFGSHSAPALYGEIEGLRNRYIDADDPTRIRASPRGPQDRKFGFSPWLAFLSDQQMARSCARAGTGLMPWIANPSYDGNPSGKGLAQYPNDARCWEENIRHVVLAGAEALIWWRRDSKSSDAENLMFDRLMDEVNSKTNGRVFRPLEVKPLRFDSRWLVSGAIRGDGKVIWRVAVSPDCPGVVIQATGQVIRPTVSSLGEWIVADTQQPLTIEPIER